MMTWYTSKPCEITKKAHINHVVFDSSWEASEAFELDRNKEVISWAKNDHLGFVVNYVFRGIVHKFYPNFLIKLANGKMLILEVKGRDNQQNRTKREYLNEWVDAVNSDRRFGKWCWDVSFRTSDIQDIISHTHSSSLALKPRSEFVKRLQLSFYKKRGSCGRCLQ
jgi:type III restriction enzyme